MCSALKASLNSGAVWEHQSSFPVALYPKCGTVQAHSITWSARWLFSPPFPGVATMHLTDSGPTRWHRCITGADIPSRCFLSSIFKLTNSGHRGALGSTASLFSMRLCPKSHLWLKLLSVFYPLQTWSIQTVAFLPLDSFCFPKKQNTPENYYFISSVTQIRRGIFFFYSFPHSCFLPLSSCLLLLTQVYFLMKRGRSYWKAA